MDQREIQRIIRHNRVIGNDDIRAGTHYIWRTQKDSKVRSSHAARDGKTFEWANPPPGGHPGEAPGCRCWAEPVIPDEEEKKKVETAFDAKNMSLSGRGAEFITSKESLELQIYEDQAGKPTIGYGHLIQQGEEDQFRNGINKQQAINLFRRDNKWAQEAVKKNVKVPLTQNQFDALTSLVFNIGSGAFSRSALLNALNNGDYEEAARRFGDWNKVTNRQTGKLEESRGLTRRRAEEREMFSRP